MSLSRCFRVKAWLEDIKNEIDRIESIFSYNLISNDDIEKSKRERVIKHLHELQILIDDILFEMDD